MCYETIRLCMQNFCTQKTYILLKKDLFCTPTVVHLPCNCSPFAYQKGYSCKANEVQMKNKTAFAPLKTIKNRSENL